MERFAIKNGLICASDHSQYFRPSSGSSRSLRAGPTLPNGETHPPLSFSVMVTGLGKIQTIVIDTIREIVSYHIISINLF